MQRRRNQQALQAAAVYDEVKWVWRVPAATVPHLQKCSWTPAQSFTKSRGLSQSVIASMPVKLESRTCLVREQSPRLSCVKMTAYPRFEWSPEREAIRIRYDQRDRLVRDRTKHINRLRDAALRLDLKSLPKI